MKNKLFSFLGLATLLVLILPLVVFALQDQYLIDFGNYESRIFNEFPNLTDKRTNLRNDDGTPRLNFTTNDIALNNWRVRLLSSGKRMDHIVHSECKEVYSRHHETNVLGVRIRFPESRQNDRAIIEPLFEFNAYDTNGQFANQTNGVIANVGIIKEISMWVKGRNYPYDMALRVYNEDHETEEYFFGNLYFDNWRKLTWVNPNYIEDVKNRVLVRKPLYPKDIPYVRFKSLVVYRHMEQIGGDFVVYFRSINFIYEKFVDVIYDGDIDDEEEWKIMQTKALKRMKKERSRLAERVDIYRSELRRLDKDE